MTPFGPDNMGGNARRELRPLEEDQTANAVPASPPARPYDAGKELDTARILDRLQWEERCAAVQRRINHFYALELHGKGVRVAAWLVMRWCLVVLLGSCFIAWTGEVALLITYGALALLLLCVAAILLGGGVELVSQAGQWWLLSRGEKDHLEVYDPSLRPTR